jgi:hypothetical protein
MRKLPMVLLIAASSGSLHQSLAAQRLSPCHCARITDAGKVTIANAGTAKTGKVYRAGQFHFGELNSVEPSRVVSPKSFSR